MQKTLEQKIKELPAKPGVYIFKDAKGLFLYVGKAINLHNRVRSYFVEPINRHATRIQIMISQIADLDYTVTDNELEGLLLENNYIKQFKPKYNVDLRDDKNYLFLKLNLKDEIPTIDFARRIEDRNAKYFGPYTNAQSIRNTLRLLRKIFPYCANKKIGSKPCFYYHIGRCPGVCIGKITPEDYRKNYIEKIIEFLQGRQSEIIQNLKLQMRGYARARLFEKAARVRDQIFALTRILERQKLVYPKKIDQDVFSIHMESTVACINLFVIREGKLTRKENFILENIKGATVQEILEEFLPKYYLEASDWPKEILAPSLEGHPPRLALNWEGAPPVKILVPTRGTKLQLIRLGTENAKQHLEATSDKTLLEEARLLSALKELQRVLELPTLPGRIEAYDISNIQGKNAVGSMIVFDFGRPKKEDYRRFKIRFKDTPDDFAMMREILTRRFRRSMIRDNDPSQITDNRSQISTWPLPNLILIDGGKGQLSTARKALSTINYQLLTIPMIGLAKRLEEIFLPNKKDPVTLPNNSIALFLLQRIRDEAHRFAVSYHRKLRSKASQTSLLDQISRIGPTKKKILLRTFGSVAKIRKASLGELSNIVGNAAAQKLKASL